MERKIDPGRYLEELDRALMEASQTGIRILGVSDFHKVFGNQFIEYAVTGPKS
jgi:hypothetical protein